ncbi:hypothetical protein JOD43_000640 [Pullulanibacillus pueri]|uniref:Uncharacterized protein n=1 Tax=Pullulanibacillus pueri TaxID=1437324 RepID=A0A8J3ERA0_9BACL|nr:hypothetical protein [Pullulanibacillus pueri]MBM7680478.1 hypothetical protein [Pullulanibacillus pueri]GGH88187.1 hypothetical protein GCM10007096_39950 [Pullulanibacillus pueri]
MKNRWSLMSMAAGAGIGAIAVTMLRNRSKSSEMKKMANDFLKDETSDYDFK